jgi:hypothetical protein
LRDRLKLKPQVAPPPTTRLGDWYANLVYVAGHQVVLALSDRSFLPVVVAGAPGKTLVPRLREAVGSELAALGVSAADVAQELQAMQEVAFAKTADRRVTGVLVDFAFQLDSMVRHHRLVLDSDRALLGVSLELAETPCGPLYKTASAFPNETAAMLFGVPRRPAQALGPRTLLH